MHLVFRELLPLTWLRVRSKTPLWIHLPRDVAGGVYRMTWAAMRLDGLEEGRTRQERAPRAQRSDGRTSSISAEKRLANKLAKRP